MKFKESLLDVDILFDENSYSTIPDEDKALSYVCYFSRNVHTFRSQLAERNWKPSEINKLIDFLWFRIIKGCMRFGIPLTTEAKGAAKRLGIIY